MEKVIHAELLSRGNGVVEDSYIIHNDPSTAQRQSREARLRQLPWYAREKR